MYKETEKVKVFALGGVDEVGKNMYIIEDQDNIFILDTGLMLPEDEMFGVDAVIPDITYLIENRERVKGIFLSHGHVDHIGALAYVLKKINVPVYGTKLTLGLAEELLKGAHTSVKYHFKTINSNSTVTIGKTTFTFFKVNHSIPDAIGIAIHTSQGVIVYTGDFKFDQTPINNEHTEIGKIVKLRKQGVICLLSDSMNAESPGTTPSESTVGHQIFEVISNAKGRIITATFAMNIHRVQQVIEAAETLNRKVAISGNPLLKNIEIASKLGHLRISKANIIPIYEIKKYPDNEIVILTTGDYGEPLAALYKMATHTHKHVRIEEGDTVIIATSATYGNEKALSRTIDVLYRAGAHVVSEKSGVHVNGHASQEELKLMINLLKPTYFIPVHGEFRMQKAHGDLAEECGVKKENIFMIEKGDVIEFSNGIAKKSEKIPAGQVLVDGLGIGDVGNIVLRDRKLLSQDGILIVVVTLDRRNYKIVSGPEIISRGFVYVRESEQLLQEANQTVTEVLINLLDQKVNEWNSLKTVIRDSLSSLLFEKTKRRPMIMPIIMEI
ncbi:ribonuclease J [Pueribacillus sp. YX66]|uniref:ribonuclease J n=1 Tax=Pueribacillus sp. YX66 TaxID=3229242 RepID=UPI00358D231E